MVAADVVGHFLGILQVDGVAAHANGKGFNRSRALPRRNGADQRGIQAAAEQKAHLGVRHQTLAHARNQLLVDVGADCLHIVGDHVRYLCQIPVADELAVFIIVSRRERQNPIRQTQQVFRLTGKDDRSGRVITVIQRTDADGVPCCHK